MARVMPDSTVGYSERLAIFDKPVQLIGIRDTGYIDYYPINDFSTQGVIQFQIPGVGSDYLDLSRSYLKVKCKIVKKDGSDILAWGDRARSTQSSTTVRAKRQAEGVNDANKNSGGTPTLTPSVSQPQPGQTGGGEESLAVVAPVNNTMHSLFSRVDVTLQNKLLTESDTSYPYQSYMKSLLYTSKEQKNGVMRMQMYFQQKKVDDTVNWVMSDDEGFKTRGAFFDGSNEVEMCGVLYCDIFSITKLLPNGVPLGITLYPNTPEFALVSPTLNADFKLVITKASFRTCTVDVSDEVKAAHAEVLNIAPAIYTYMKSEVKRFTLPKGLFSTDINDPFTGRIPSEMVIGIVKARAAHGSYNTDPYNFEHCNVARVQVTADGSDLGEGAIETNYNKKNALHSEYLDAYRSLVGAGLNEDDIPVTRQEFQEGGSTLYRFVAAPENLHRSVTSEDGVTPLKRLGNLRVNLRFAKELKEPMTVVIFAKFPAGIKIDKSRMVSEL
jgi:hypothetical protein